MTSMLGQRLAAFMDNFIMMQLHFVGEILSEKYRLTVN